jgi:RNA polymerase sigma-70 factor (ECF subfamily)
MMPASALASPAVGAPAFDIAAVYRSHGAAVARWAARLAGPDLEAEDLVQEVFMIAQRKLPTFRGEASPARWLYRITERVVSHRRRSERWRRWLVGSPERVVGDLPAPGATPLEVVQRAQAATLFYRALDGMPENHRTAFILFELEELSGAEIATLKGVRVATVWVWLHRARAQFLERLAQQEAQEKQQQEKAAAKQHAKRAWHAGWEPR